MKKRKITIPAQSNDKGSKVSLLSRGFSWHGHVVFAFASLIYMNTLTHEYTQDDAIVIYDNMYTTQGIKGIPGLFSKDTFFGFFKTEGKANLVSGGRYRPFTPAMFAVEYEIAGNNPWLGHLINILLYGLLCFMIYKVLLLLFCHKNNTENNRYFVLAVSLIFAAHPIHTEAVANIKGRDEIMCMIGSIAALFLILKYVDLKEVKYLWFAALSFFIAILSKENTITFLAVIPLSLYYFRDLNVKDAFLKSAILLIPVFVFLIIRGAILGNDFGGTPMELMNNPYLKLVNGTYVPFDLGEKVATILFTLGKYVQLLIFPHPLTHDYYPRHIDIMHFSDPGVIVSLVLYIYLIYLAISGLRSKSIIGFGATYFLITLSIVSNVVFPIGTNMSERFMFMPSFGFALIIGYLFKKYIFEKGGQKAFYIALGILISLYSLKTISRNFVWVNDFTLFTTDVKNSGNSAKVLNAAGGALTTEAFKEEDQTKKEQMLKEAIGYLNKAVVIHPTYKNAYLIMGNAYYYLKEYDLAITAFDNALRLDSDFKDAATNLAVTLRDAGRKAGEVEQNLDKAEKYLRRSLSLFPDDAETLRLLGVATGIKGNHVEAITYFERVVKLLPDHAPSYMNLSNAYRNAGDLNNSEKYRLKALELDPTILNNQ
ncbi:MAG: tetratricopeptide repeat protein [Saprospiraceae bacterium]|nr:tetratricopeptide repeat protein [Saprospiraceae bacterium]